MLQACTQSTRASNRVFQGTGLGLFICVTLCQNLNGFVSWSSTSGTGTVFHVGIPVNVEEATMEDAASKSAADEPPDRSISVRGPIVVCDDNVVNVKILKRGLELDLKNQNLDHLEVLTADGGTRAVSLYDERRPSLIFCDYHMPDMDGAEATRRIRRYEAEQSLQPAFIIIYTADLTDDASSLLKDAGANEIMEKPPPKGFIASIVKRIVVEEHGEQT